MPSVYQQPRDLKYENTHRAYDFQLDDNFGIKCINHKYCRAVLPDWWWDCMNSYICTNCDMLHGPMEEEEGIECPVCLNTSTCVILACKHPLCETCFKRCHFPKDPPQPNFPLPELEEEYDDEPENPKWLRDYPLIQDWQQEMNKWFDDKEERFDNEKYLRVCPLCRK